MVKEYVEKFVANCGKFSVTSVSAPVTVDTSVVTEYLYNALINPQSNNYSSGRLNFKLIVEPRELNPYFTAYGNDEYMITTGDYTTKPQGTFDLYANDELVMEDIAYQTRFTWRPEKSGTYTLRAVYNPIDNDTFKVNDAVSENREINLRWKINCINCGAYDYKYGETARVNHSLGDKFGGWKFYDENGNEFTPENVDAETSSWVSFTMPDFAITVEAVDTSASGGSTGGIFDGLGDLTEGDSDCWLVNIINNIIAKFKSVIETITGFFRGIGDNT